MYHLHVPVLESTSFSWPPISNFDFAAERGRFQILATFRTQFFRTRAAFVGCTFNVHPTKAARVRKNWVRKVARVTRADKRRMVELREET